MSICRWCGKGGNRHEKDCPNLNEYLHESGEDATSEQFSDN